MAGIRSIEVLRNVCVIRMGKYILRVSSGLNCLRRTLQASACTSYSLSVTVIDHLNTEEKQVNMPKWNVHCNVKLHFLESTSKIFSSSYE